MKNFIVDNNCSNYNITVACNVLKIKLEIKNINTKDAEQIISKFNKPNLNQTTTKKTQTSDKSKVKTKKK